MAPTTNKLARRFASIIRFDFTAKQLAEIKRRNRKYDHNICATHDFCDANMVMWAAYEDVYGRAPEIGGDTEASQAEIAIWNEAWAKAKRRYLS
jgi:hypothetical protein